MMKRVRIVLSILLAVTMLLTLCACASPSLEAATGETVESEETVREQEEQGEITYPEGFSAGYGRTDITPDVFPVDLGAGAVAKSAVDPLYATCTALCDGETVAIVFHLDMKSIPNVFVGTVTQRLTKKFGIPAENVILNATHSHNAPLDVTGSDDGSIRWRQQVLKAMDQAVEDALRDLAPAQIYISKGDTTGFAYVRRYLMADGSYKGIQSANPSNDYVAHETEADPELRVIRFDRGDKKDILMVNWQGHAAHGRDLHPSVISSDFINELRSGVEKELDVHFAYQNGASGNLNFTDQLGGQKFANFHEVGTALADVVAGAVKNEERVDSGKVRVATATVACEVFVDDPVKVEGAKKYDEASEAERPAILAEYGLASSYEVSAIKSRQKRLEQGPTSDITLSAISCGDIAFYTSPFEQFDSDGKYIRDNSPFKMTFSCAYSNGINGYLPSSAAYLHGEYEVYSTPFVYGTADQLNETSVGLLKALKN